jgi:hypothetical protein
MAGMEPIMVNYCSKKQIGWFSVDYLEQTTEKQFKAHVETLKKF